MAGSFLGVLLNQRHSNQDITTAMNIQDFIPCSDNGSQVNKQISQFTVTTRLADSIGALISRQILADQLY